MCTSIVGEARQRFQVVEPLCNWSQINHVVQVRILPEYDDLNMPKEFIDSAYWSLHQCSLFDGQELVRRIQKQLRQSNIWKALVNTDDKSMYQRIHVQQDVRLFSYWAAGNLPFSDDDRQALLQINSSVQRLRQLLPIFETDCCLLHCARCSVEISTLESVFSWDERGSSIGTFVNPHGFVHQMITLCGVSNVIPDDNEPSLQDCWFPGYGWTLLFCSRCGAHLGWQFEWQNVQENDPPHVLFWGISRACLRLQLKRDEEDSSYDQLVIADDPRIQRT